MLTLCTTAHEHNRVDKGLTALPRPHYTSLRAMPTTPTRHVLLHLGTGVRAGLKPRDLETGQGRGRERRGPVQ